MQSAEFAKVFGLLPAEGGQQKLLEVSVGATLKYRTVLEDIRCIILEIHAKLHGFFIIGKCTGAGPSFE